MDPTSLTSWTGWVFWIGVLLIVAGFAVAAYRRFSLPALKRGFSVAGIGLVVLVVAIIVGAATPSATSGNVVPPAPSNASVISYISSTPAFPAGCSVNSAIAIPTLSCTVVYNSTTNYFAFAPKNGTTGAGTIAGVAGCTSQTSTPCPTILYVPIHSARSDSLNFTYGFNYQVTSIPTTNSLGANPQPYSLVGYTAPTSTAQGQWLIKWGAAGSFIGQNPNVNAPSVSTNLGVNTVGIAAFSSKTPYVSIQLAGSNSTSAPTTFYSAIQTFTPYSITISVGGSSPSQFIVNLTVIGERGLT